MSSTDRCARSRADIVTESVHLLRLKAVSRRFGGLTALHDVCLDLVAGTRHAVIGPNGAGKSTLINLIAGTLCPSTGTVTFDGCDITRLSAPARARHGIGRTWQHPAVFGRLTVTDNLALARSRTAKTRPLSRGDSQTLAATLVEDGGLAEYAAVPAGQLPYGLQRRLELAMALAARPRLLLLDEPSAGLDPDELTHLTRLITTHTGDLTVLLVDHNLDLVWTLADTVTVLHHGRQVATAPPAVIRADPKVQAAYLATGDPPPTRPHRHTPPGGPALLRVRQLHAGYRGACAVTGIDLDVHPGEAVAVLGRNGAGKTTLLNAVAGLLVPEPGSHIELAGRRLIGRPHHRIRSGLAIVPQGRRLFPNLTVTEHLICATAARRTPPTDTLWTVARIWTLLPALAERAQHPARLLSGGEQQMLALARALLTQPRLLILDEPSEGLAPAVIAQLTTTLTDLVADGLAVLIAEQNLALAAALTDRVIVLDGGRIAMAAATRELAEPAHRHRLHSLLGVTDPADTATSAVAGPPEWVDSGLDIITPTPARVINALLGGYHSFGVDRDLADEMRQAWPGYVSLVWAQKAWEGRVVAWLTAQGIRQVVDIGCGLAVLGAVHDAAGPDMRIVYADVDPIAVSLIRHTLADHRHVAVVHGDLRRPAGILNHDTTQAHLDFSEPVAVLLTGVLPHIADLDNPAGIIAQIRDAVVAGSYLAVSHVAPVAALRREQEGLRRLYDRTPTPLCLHTQGQLADLLAGWELVEPGIVPVTDWRPDPDLHGDPPTDAGLLGVVARAS